MIFTCDRTKLVVALSTVSKAVATKSTIPALEGILVTAKNGSLSFCGYNLELGITTSFTAKIEQEGSLVLPANLFTEIVRKLPGDSVHFSLSSDFKAEITSESSAFSLMGFDPKDFPVLPKVDDAQCFELPVSLLRSMIKQTLFAVADVDSKPVHMGTLFEIKDGEFIMVSVDGYRMAMRREALKTDLNFRFVVPGKTLKEVLRLLPENEEGSIKISVGSRHIIFYVEEFSIISRLLEGEFLDYYGTIPSKIVATAKINTKTFIESIERVSLLIEDRLKSPIRCVFGNENVQLSCTTSSGRATDEFAIKFKGKESVELAFNDKYMLDALKNSSTDELVLNFSGSLSPIKITPVKDENFIYLVLPVRVRNES